MNQESKKKWFKDPTVWSVIAAFLAIIVTIVLFVIPKSSDFSMTIEPFEGEVEKGKSISAVITVEGQKYKDQIKLVTKSQNDKIDISFDPSIGIPSPSFNSTMNISIENNISEGNYIIEVIGIGAKNKIEHSTNFFLKVGNPPFSPQKLTDLFYPDGWMGDIRDITLDHNYKHNPYSGESCIRIAYSARGSYSQNWAGIYWLYPNNNWGDNPEGRDLTGATSLYFMAKGEKGGEKAEFKIGGISGKFQGSFQPPVSKILTLTSEWKEYSIGLKGKDLSNVFGGFCWVTNTNQNPHGCIIFLDDVIYK